MIVTPQCCQLAKTTGVIILQFSSHDIYQAGPEGQIGKMPRWVARGLNRIVLFVPRPCQQLGYGRSHWHEFAQS